MSQSVKAVTFDAGGTLIHTAASVGETYSRFAYKYDVKADAEKLDAAFRAFWKKTPQPDHTSEKSEKAWWRTLVFNIFDYTIGAQRFSDFESFFEELYQYYGMAEAWEPDIHAKSVLNQLGERGIQLAVISNFDARLRPILTGLGLIDHFHHVIISNEVLISKPDRRIFELAIEKLAVDPAEILHVGDDPVCDVEGAEQVGMQTMLVRKGGRALSEIPDTFCLRSL